MHTILALAAPLLAIDPTGAHASDVVKQFAGNAFLAVLAVRGVIAFWRRRLMEIVALAILAGAVAIFIYIPGTFQELGRVLVGVFSG